MIAPATAAARISAPVFLACMRAQFVSGHRRRADRCETPAARSSAWPPTIPHAPAARATTPMTRSLRAHTTGSLLSGAARHQRERLREQAVAGQDGHALRLRRREASVVPVASCRCPWRAGRRESASRCGSARSRRRRASPARDRRPTASALARHRIGTQPLASGGEAVTHRIRDDAGAVGRAGKDRCEGGFDFGAARAEIVAEPWVHAVDRRGGSPQPFTRALLSSSSLSASGAGLS